MNARKLPFSGDWVISAWFDDEAEERHLRHQRLLMAALGILAVVAVLAAFAGFAYYAASQDVETEYGVVRERPPGR